MTHLSQTHLAYALGSLALLALLLAATPITIQAQTRDAFILPFLDVWQERQDDRDGNQNRGNGNRNGNEDRENEGGQNADGQNENNDRDNEEESDEETRNEDRSQSDTRPTVPATPTTTPTTTPPTAETDDDGGIAAPVTPPSNGTPMQPVPDQSPATRVLNALYGALPASFNPSNVYQSERLSPSAFAFLTASAGALAVIGLAFLLLPPPASSQSARFGFDNKPLPAAE